MSETAPEPVPTDRSVDAEILAAIESARLDLVALSRHLHENPELGFEERVAHGVLTDYCEGRGWDVERHAVGLDTAFRARIGDGDGPNIAVICEYDALPGLGHACGHNIIAAAGVGAAVGAAAVVSALGGRLTVLGTPAEEGGGGKALMIDRGAFEGIDVALMVHPADADELHMATLAISEVVCTFHGQASHAASSPSTGRNALDAAILGYQAVGALRQHIADSERVHGIITHGGDKPNIVPQRAESQWYVRSTNRRSLAALRERVVQCQRAGAAAAACDLSVRFPSPFYDELLENGPLDQLAEQLAHRVGRRLGSGPPSTMGSTDMGNVSQIVPSIHPMLKVAPAGTSIHTPEFAEAAASEGGDRAVTDGAVLMASMCAALWTDRGRVDAARADLAARRSVA